MKLYVAPLPNALLVEDFLEQAQEGNWRFALSARYGANEHTYYSKDKSIPGWFQRTRESGADLWGCALGGPECPGFSYKEHWHFDDSVVFYGLWDPSYSDVGRSFPSNPPCWFDQQYWDEGREKYQMLTKLMAELDWGGPSDPYWYTGSGYDDWVRRAENLLLCCVSPHYITDYWGDPDGCPPS